MDTYPSLAFFSQVLKYNPRSIWIKTFNFLAASKFYMPPTCWSIRFVTPIFLFKIENRRLLCVLTYIIAASSLEKFISYWKIIDKVLICVKLGVPLCTIYRKISLNLAF